MAVKLSESRFQACHHFGLESRSVQEHGDDGTGFTKKPWMGPTNIPICEPWCWYIYLHDWVINLGQMLGFIFQHHGSQMGLAI